MKILNFLSMKDNPIILVDDDIDDVSMIKEAIAILGLKNDILVFQTGQKAYDFISDMKDIPFFILCDINMPEMDGIELRQKIYENEALKAKAIPFIFMTTAGNAGHIHRAYNLSVQGYFIKPNRFETLVQMIKSISDYWKNCQHPNSVSVIAKV